MKLILHIKYFILLFLTFLLGAQVNYVHAELVLPIKSISFSIEQNQSFNNLEKVIQPNIGFLKEKTKFGKSNGSSTRINCNYTKLKGWKVADAGSDLYKSLSNVLKSSYDDLVANPSTRKFANTLSIEEEAVLKFYTTNEGYEFFNKALRGEIPMTDEFRAFDELINSGMDKLPKYNGTNVFRGVYGQEAVIAKTWKKGDEIPFDDFKSSSIQKNVAEDFMVDNQGDVMYEILNPKGNNICNVSCLPGEAEILFKSGSKFKVEEVFDGFNFLDPNDPLTILATGRKVVLKLID